MLVKVWGKKNPLLMEEVFGNIPLLKILRAPAF
jgi:hypothetical protein